ncbi:MAG TPA: hypothetical protein VMV24_00120 [Candidatus Dormibacteraeota bacterium]|nr:hypothetical protein [Candidatus Dormibacteraeota bacterium]
MNSNQQMDNPTAEGSVTQEQLQVIKTSIVTNARNIAMQGIKTVKSTDDSTTGDNLTYDWWENEQSFDNNFWSISFWDYPNNRWQIQVTKIIIQNTGRSLMVSYSVRMDDDKSFPGFQIYEESVDDSYRPFNIEEYVLLNRVLLGIQSALPQKA